MVWNPLRRSRQARLAERETFRLVHKAAHEDVAVFGEELTQLERDVLVTPLDESMRSDYDSALASHDTAKTRLASAGVAADLTEVTSALAEGRFAHACVLAGRDGTPRPTRRESCFFNPAHGPAHHDVAWAPPGGVPRDVPVCFRDFERLTIGEAPAVRLVRVGNRHVAWFASGPNYAAWAQGWYADLVADNRLAADRLTMAYAGTRVDRLGAAAAAAGVAGAIAWTDPGAWDGGGTIGGHDHSGGSDGGGFSGGGFSGGSDGGGGGDGGGGS